MGYPLGGTNAPKIGVYNISDDTLATAFGTAGYYALDQVATAAEIEVEPVEEEFEKTDRSISTDREGIMFASIELTWEKKTPADLVNLQAIVNIDPGTYYLKLWIHSDDAVSHKVKVKKIKPKYHQGKYYLLDVTMEFAGIEVESTLNLNEA